MPIRDVTLLGQEVTAARLEAQKTPKRREIAPYPEPVEVPIVPDDECCHKVCGVVNDLIDRHLQGVRTCEHLADIGAKGACYTRLTKEIDAMRTFRIKLNEKGVCKCYEEEFKF